MNPFFRPVIACSVAAVCLLSSTAQADARSLDIYRKKAQALAPKLGTIEQRLAHAFEVLGRDHPALRRLSFDSSGWAHAHEVLRCLQGPKLASYLEVTADARPGRAASRLDLSREKPVDVIAQVGLYRHARLALLTHVLGYLPSDTSSQWISLLDREESAMAFAQRVVSVLRNRTLEDGRSAIEALMQVIEENWQLLTTRPGAWTPPSLTYQAKPSALRKAAAKAKKTVGFNKELVKVVASAMIDPRARLMPLAALPTQVRRKISMAGSADTFALELVVNTTPKQLAAFFEAAAKQAEL